MYQNVKSTEECREKCLSSPYRCHSFDLGGDPSSPNRVCRTSHLDKYSLAHIEEAYLQVPGAITYELHSCYNGKLLGRSFSFNLVCTFFAMYLPCICLFCSVCALATAVVEATAEAHFLSTAIEQFFREAGNCRYCHQHHRHQQLSANVVLPPGHHIISQSSASGERAERRQHA